ncbi:MAG: hypothetical protein ACR2RE_28755 [Geminicoccaceae bacterium]
MTKIESLRGTTPAEIFQSGLENLNDIEAVAVSVLWKNNTISAGWSNMPDIGRLAIMILALDERQRASLFRAVGGEGL